MSKGTFLTIIVTLGVLVSLFIIGVAITAPSAGNLGPIGPAALYPTASYTPGVAATLSAADLQARYGGQTYSQANRNVTTAEKNAVKKEYAATAATCTPSTCEVDHFYPLCAGGSNDIKNLWLEPATNMWQSQNFGFHQKDQLETYICAQIKAGALDPKVAYQKMTTDWVAFYLEAFWVAFYLEAFESSPQYGSTQGYSSDEDGDDY